MDSQTSQTIPAETYLNLWHARGLMDRQLEEPLDLAQVARVAHFSPYHFLRLFRQAYGETPHQYLTRRRIERAKELLTGSDLSVTAVCLAVGFSSLGSFSTLFRRYVGHPPQHYRARVYQSVWIVERAAPVFVPMCYVMMFTAGRSTGELSNFVTIQV